MSLRRFQPISRAAPWTILVSWTDPRTRLRNSLADAILTLGLYQGGEHCCGDYGRLWGGWCGPWDGYGVPALAAATQTDGSGPFVILPGLEQARGVFTPDLLARLHPGDARLIIWATVDGATEEIERETIRVLEGPRAMPNVPQVAPPPDLAQGIAVVVTVDGGDR